jgi:glycerol-3-phosphate acyltransferase PlsX
MDYSECAPLLGVNGISIICHGTSRARAVMPIKPICWYDLKEMAKKMDYSEYGGAPLLGVNGISIICHGTSRARAVKNAVHYAHQAVTSDLLGMMRRGLE